MSPLDRKIKSPSLQLSDFITNNLATYNELRNFDYGSDNHTNVSCLSRYLSHRVLTEYEVINRLIAECPGKSSEKFIQEILWRIYWRGWLEKRPKVWTDYIETSSKQVQSSDYLRAIRGNTEINAFNDWVHELKEFNYLHNHTRMWFASIWIFTLELPWQLGASFFLKHLLDGDSASNTLSWRWIAGIQTKGKNYIARKSNIEKYSKKSITDGQLNESAQALIETYEYNMTDLPSRPSTWSKNKFLLIFDNEYNQNNSNINFFSYEKIFLLLLNNERRQVHIDPKVLEFKHNLQSVFHQKLRNSEIIGQNSFEEMCKDTQEIDVLYPFIGENFDYLNRLKRTKNTKFNFIYNNQDIYCWKFSNKGYFNFKKNSPDILRYISDKGKNGV